MNTDNLRVKWIEVEASVWEAQQAEVKALREEIERLKERELDQIAGIEGLNALIADLESQLAELRQGGEVAGWRPKINFQTDFTAGEPSKATVEYWREQGVDIEYAYLRPQPAIQPGYVVVKSELFEAVAALVRFAGDWNQGTHAKLYRPVICRLVGEHIAEAPAIQPGYAVPDAMTFLRDNDMAASDDWMQGWNDCRAMLAAPADSKEEK